ncbi:MAG: hypothetical protein LC122_00585 [Chitinophagales bacterium]|nr:hypothetical protein [Chitinophagales bacterium]
MKRIIFINILFCCLFSIRVNANDTTINYSLYQSVKGNFTNFNIDNLGNIFLVTPTNQIKKLNANLDSVSIFNDIKQYSTIDFIDVSNPLKILAYYKNFSTILVLDRFLSFKAIIDLRQLNITQVKAIAQSYDNNIWIFDEQNAVIKKVNDYGRVIFSSSDFRVLFNDVPNPSKIIDADGLLYLYNKNYGWLVFDYYGSLKNSYTNLLDWQDVQVLKGKLFGRKNNQLLIFDIALQELKTFSVNISLQEVKKIIQTERLLYTLTEEGLIIYKKD